MSWRVISSPDWVIGDSERFPGSRLYVSCGGCGHFKSYGPGRVIMRLRELRLGGYKTPLPRVAESVERKCPRCGKRNWRAELAWPPGFTEGDAKRAAARARN
jgi:hypothetical protein